VGEPGEAFAAELELKLLADVGLVGLPSAGKSTFLASVTNATPEIADYPFTTLTPHLGIATVDRHDILIADIPGLIEGASEGKGLGHAFLRHIDRTAVLLHLVDVYNDDAGKAYAIIRRELEKYSDLKDRPEIVALTKTEGLDPEIIEMQKQAILSQNPLAKVFAISSIAHQGTTELLRELYAEIVKNTATQATTNLDNVLDKTQDSASSAIYKNIAPEDVPVIKLSDKAYANVWQVVKGDDGVFHISGEKIEKFARRTDLANYASVNRLRDIMKKLGIRAELTTQGAEPDSIIEIAGKEFTLVEAD
jgi:GTP-binding protein